MVNSLGNAKKSCVLNDLDDQDDDDYDPNKTQETVDVEIECSEKTNLIKTSQEYGGE